MVDGPSTREVLLSAAPVANVQTVSTDEETALEIVGRCVPAVERPQVVGRVLDHLVIGDRVVCFSERGLI